MSTQSPALLVPFLNELVDFDRPLNSAVRAAIANHLTDLHKNGNAGASAPLFPLLGEILDELRNTRRDIAALHQEVLDQGARMGTQAAQLTEIAGEIRTAVTTLIQHRDATIAQLQQTVSDLEAKVGDNPDLQPQIDDLNGLLSLVQSADVSAATQVANSGTSTDATGGTTADAGSSSADASSSAQ